MSGPGPELHETIKQYLNQLYISSSTPMEPSKEKQLLKLQQKKPKNLEQQQQKQKQQPQQQAQQQSQPQQEQLQPKEEQQQPTQPKQQLQQEQPQQKRQEKESQQEQPQQKRQEKESQQKQPQQQEPTSTDNKKTKRNAKANALHSKLSDVKPPRKKFKQNSLFKKQQKFAHADYIKELLRTVGQPPPGAELQTFIAQVQPNQNAVFQALNLIATSIKEILNPKFNVTSVQPFGSAVNGLVLKDSDLDIFVGLNAQGLSESEIVEVFRILKKTLIASKQFFNVIIINARVPIIKCIHRATEIYCDLNITNNAGTFNSRYILHVLSSDNRVREAAVLIKFWAKHHNLSKTGLITNYCIVMMFIFGMQCMATPFAYPIRLLQSTVPPLQVGKWNFAFDTMRPPCARHSSLTAFDLISEFFTFYSYFDFDKFVVSPLNGHPILHDEFERIQSHYANSPDWKPRKHWLTVQDPFELDRNVGSTCSKRLQLTFQHLCRFSNTLFNKHALGTNPMPFLRALFTDPAPELASLKKRRDKKKFQIVLAVDHTGRKALLKANENNECVGHTWSELAIEVIHRILSSIFFGTVDPDRMANKEEHRDDEAIMTDCADDKPASRTANYDKQKKGKRKNQSPPLMFNYQFNKNVWTHRKIEAEKSLEALEAETVALAASQDTAPFAMRCYVTFDVHPGAESMTMVIRDVTKTDEAVTIRDATKTDEAVTTRDATKTDEAVTIRDATKTDEAVTIRDATKTDEAVTTRDATKTDEALTIRDVTKTDEAMTAFQEFKHALESILQKQLRDYVIEAAMTENK